MSDRGRVVMIFGAVAIVAAGAGYYFFAIRQPAQQLEEARAEIATWEERYQQARDCLLGKAPGSTKTSEALAIREMAPDPWDRGRCTPLVSKLSRGMTSDTGVAAVEAAWGELDKAAHAAAISFAKHVSKSTTLEADPLPVALDDLDAARDKLRAAAKLPVATHAGSALPPAQIVPLVDGAEPVVALDTQAPSAHGFVAFGKTASREVQIVLAPGAAPNVMRVGPGSLRALPDTSWGATAGRLVFGANLREAVGEIQAGAFDAEGVMKAPTKLSLEDNIPAPLLEELGAKPGGFANDIVVASAVGTLADGAILYSGLRTAIVARTKGGVFAAGEPILFDTATSAGDVDGRFVLIWARDGIGKALLVGNGREETFELPAPSGPDACLTKQRIFAMASGELYAFGGGQPLARLPLAQDMLLEGCTADAAVIRMDRDDRRVAICTNDCRSAMIPNAAPDAAAIAVVGGKLRAFETHANVLGVWSEDGLPRFYALPRHARLDNTRGRRAMATTDGKVIDLVARVDDRYVVIRIPAS